MWIHARTSLSTLAVPGSMPLAPRRQRIHVSVPGCQSNCLISTCTLSLYTARNSFSDVTANNILALVDIMETSYDDFIAKHLKTNADGFHVAEQADTDRANFQKAKDFYNVCLKPERSIAEVYPDIAYLRNTLMGNHTTPETIPAQLGHVLAFLTRSDVPSIVDASVTRNDENHDYNMIFFTALKVSPEPIKFIEAVVTNTLGQHNQTQQVIKASHDANIQLWSQSQVKTAVSTYVGVQEQVQKIFEAYVYMPTKALLGN